MYDTITISIGRNVGDKPMSDDRWYDFRVATLAVVERYARVVFSGMGTGRYAGAVEESFTLVATLTRNITGLYHELGEVAHAFDQDSIALTTGKVSFPGTEV